MHRKYFDISLYICANISLIFIEYLEYILIFISPLFSMSLIMEYTVQSLQTITVITCFTTTVVRVHTVFSFFVLHWIKRKTVIKLLHTETKTEKMVCTDRHVIPIFMPGRKLELSLFSSLRAHLMARRF